MLGLGSLACLQFKTVITNSLVVLSARMPQLVSIILEAGAASNLIEDYAACLETRAEESQAPENPDEDIGSLILRVCVPISSLCIHILQIVDYSCSLTICFMFIYFRTFLGNLLY